MEFPPFKRQLGRRVVLAFYIFNMLALQVQCIITSCDLLPSFTLSFRSEEDHFTTLKVYPTMGLCRFLKFNSLFLVMSLVSVAYGEDMEQKSLLLFKSRVVSDPECVLENWGSPNSHMCDWEGIGCNKVKDHVVQIDLNGKSLRGTISPVLANLSHLTVLDLSGNSFSGHIPVELGSLFRLKQLSFSSNLLEGEIPAELGLLHQLVYLNLGSNKLIGNIPASLFCNGSSALEYVDLSNNSLSGNIPLWNQCDLIELRFLLLWSNKLVGQVPPTLSNSSKLEWLDLESNFLGGDLPFAIINKMSHLQFLYLSDNDFDAHDNNTNLTPFFASLVNSSNLQELDLASNNLGGEIPSIIGDLSTNLVQINLGENHIHGSVPPSISNLVNLTLLNLSSNLLEGSIPSEIGQMGKLERVILSNNSLSGEIPSAFSDIPHLGLLDLSKNRLSGSIPDTLSSLYQLRRLLLHDNFLSGTIPQSLGNCVNLEILDLSHNRISGRVPNEVAGLSGLKLYLNLSNNFLQGPIPLELSKMDMVLEIDFSSNNLTGLVPPQLGSCIALEYLNLSQNLLQGSLPIQIGSLPYLQVLDISSNYLTGDIPQFLQGSKSLKKLNISFNNFSGEVPNEGIFKSLTSDSLRGNPHLCGSISSAAGLQPCMKKQAHKSFILPILLVFLGITTIYYIGYPLVLKARAIQKSFNDDISDEEEQEQSKYPRISYRELMEATSGFHHLSLIGSGMFGNVYKGVLEDNTKIAVKVFDSDMGMEMRGSFKRECQVLRRTRHRNLIKIITACSRPGFKAIVLPLMPNGSLESLLYCSSSGLNFVQLVSICSDIAEGVAYLHHHSLVKVIHCDLKPSNILLDDDMTALVSDFGIAMLLKGGENEKAMGSYPSVSSTAGVLCGSIGYIAPEYAMGKHASTQGDVYSFGVILLEIITGKRPTDVLLHQGSSLNIWVKSLYPYKLEPIVKQALLRFPPPATTPAYSSKSLQDVVIEMIELGLMCTQHSPSMRPSMLDVVNEMGWLKQYVSDPSSLTIEEASSKV